MVTLTLDPDSQARLDDWRARYFPAERNFLRAHLTLFHALPASEKDAWMEHLRKAAAATGPMPLSFGALVRNGAFVSVEVDAKAVRERHDELRKALFPILTRQDAQGLKPHVTLVNKVPVEEAVRRHAALAGEFFPWQGMARGFDIWAYEGGPWRFEESLAFLTDDRRNA